LVGGNDEPEHQQCWRNGGNADRCGEGLQQQHGGTLPRLRKWPQGQPFARKSYATPCRQMGLASGLPQVLRPAGGDEAGLSGQASLGVAGHQVYGSIDVSRPAVVFILGRISPCSRASSVRAALALALRAATIRPARLNTGTAMPI